MQLFLKSRIVGRGLTVCEYYSHHLQLLHAPTETAVIMHNSLNLKFVVIREL